MTILIEIEDTFDDTNKIEEARSISLSYIYSIASDF